MRATVMYGAGDVRVEDVPDARLIDSMDALVGVTRSAICGSDLWPYKSMPHGDAGRRMGHEFIGVAEAVGADVAMIKAGDLVVSPFASIAGGPAPVRAYIEELLPDVLEGRIEPGRVFDRSGSIDSVPDGYRAMNDRDVLKFQIVF